MSAPAQRERTHWDLCWQVHGDCALTRATRVLEAASRAVDQHALAVLGLAAADHASGPCPEPDGCYAVTMARGILRDAGCGR